MVTNYFQVYRLLKNPFKNVLIIYSVYLLVNAYTFFNFIAIPELIFPTNQTEAISMILPIFSNIDGFMSFIHKFP